jgi:hypothetical protein
MWYKNMVVYIRPCLLQKILLHSNRLKSSACTILCFKRHKIKCAEDFNLLLYNKIYCRGHGRVFTEFIKTSIVFQNSCKLGLYPRLMFQNVLFGILNNHSVYILESTMQRTHQGFLVGSTVE